MSAENGAAPDAIDGTAVEETMPVVPEIGALVPTGASVAVTPAVQAEELVERLAVIKDAMERAMKRDVDYGVIPGTDKPALYKPGSEKLSVLFQLDVQLTNEKRWEENGHLTVISRATAFHAPSGTRLGYGEGICTTRERKYGKRKQERVCPSCGIAAVIKGKAEYGGGWLCWKKRDGCGAKFAEDDPQVIAQEVGEIDNPDLPDLWNTVVKMAEKRARVDVVLAVTGASALFTQDIEDGQPSPDIEGGSEAQAAPPQATARERKASERPITGAQKGKINALLAKAGLSAEEASAVRVWFCSKAECAQFDRLPAACASELIEQLGEDGSGASVVLDDLKIAASNDNEIARKILSRMEGTDA